MPLPVAVALGTVISAIIIPLIVKVMIAFGLGFVTYTGVQLLLDSVVGAIDTQLNSIAFTGTRELLAYMNADKAITMIVSAVTIRATLRGLSVAGDIKKLGFV